MVARQHFALYGKDCLQHSFGCLFIASVSQQFAERVQGNRHIRMRAAQEPFLHQHCLCFQRFRLLKLFRGAYRPGEIMERCRHRWMFRTVEIATHLENLARCFFRFGPLPAISQNHTKIAEHIGHLRTVVSTDFPADSQRFPSHRLRLRNITFFPIHRR